MIRINEKTAAAVFFCVNIYREYTEYHAYSKRSVKTENPNKIFEKRLKYN